jgi:hypothetical protein
VANRYLGFPEGRQRVRTPRLTFLPLLAEQRIEAWEAAAKAR